MDKEIDRQRKDKTIKGHDKTWTGRIITSYQTLHLLKYIAYSLKGISISQLDIERITSYSQCYQHVDLPKLRFYIINGFT